MNNLENQKKKVRGTKAIIKYVYPVLDMCGDCADKDTCDNHLEAQPYGDKIGVLVAVDMGNGSAQVGWSACSPKDQFSKVKGKFIAINRAESKYGAYWISKVLIPESYQPYFEFFVKRLKDKVNHKWGLPVS